ncbi:MAG: tetratricopeptide repeat protein [Nitrospirae bacterium]|nr:tetratricopeptide repeat protein [Nitrospirota bacterium]
MGEQVRVYISSTYDDLKDYRAEVIKALRKIDITLVNMENYNAGDKKAIKKCQEDVAGCTIYVGIFARNYGFVPKSHRKSFPELEYREAKKKKLSILIFLLNETIDWPRELCSTRNDERWLNELKVELKNNKTVRWFKNHLELVVEVMASVFEEILKPYKEKALNELYASVSVADTPEKKAVVEQAIDITKEKMLQSSDSSQQSGREPIPIPLPRLRGTFVGREKERKTLLHCLNFTDKRLVVIIAPGGYGKTELVTKVLKKIAPTTTITNNKIQGILYLRCVAGDINMGTVFTEAGKIAGTSEAFFNVYKNDGISNKKKLYYFYGELSKIGNIWIVMDSFEYLLDAKDDTVKDVGLREFLETAVSIDHSIRIIITSRVLPKFKGNRSVEPIDLSEGLPEEKAVEYLRYEGAKYGLKDEDKSILLAFVRRVHCIPQALESIVGYLSEHFPAIKLKDILANDGIFSDFDKHDHEEGLKSLILEQIKRLRPELQLALSVLSVFSKPPDQKAVCYMLQGMSSVELAFNLSRLEKNRLITHNNGTYDMHPVVRELVYDMIPQNALSSDETGNGDYGKQPTFTRAGLHMKAAKFFKNIRKPESDWKTIDDLEPQLQEIHHQIRAGNFEDAAIVLNIIDYDYLLVWGYYEKITELRQQLIGKLKDKELVGMNLGRLGTAYWNIGSIQDFINYTDQALQIAKEVNNKERIWAWLNNLGRAYADLSEITKAIDYYEHGLTISQNIGDKRGEVILLNNLGRAYADIGKTNKAIEYLEKALTINKEDWNKRIAGITLGYLGSAYYDLGKTTKSIEYLEQALTVTREIGYKRINGYVLGYLGDVYLSIGDTDEAVIYNIEALKIGKNIGKSDIITTALLQLAYTYQCVVNLVDAESYYKESLDYDFPVNTCHSMVYLGVLLLENTHTAEAQDFIDRGITLCREILEKTPNRYKQLFTLALALLSKGNVLESLDTYKKAIVTCPAKGVLKKELMTLDLLDRAVPECPGLNEAQKLLTEAQA